jgi:AcrR family transcriptional regulator
LEIKTTRERLLDAAYRIISEGSLSQLSIDRVTERAGLSRRTFFLHFSSKDALLAEVLDYLRPAEAEKWRQWRESLDPDLGVEDRIYSLFRYFVEAIDAPRWRGCCFVRISAEFADRLGHPVHAVVAAAHQDLEHWLAEELAQGDYAAPSLLAKQLVVLLNGLLITQLVHRDKAYSASVLCLLPDILASGRSSDHKIPQPAMRLAVSG